ncbi:hypothetical protein BH23VER1_BH23VER1_25040 [soil metagenome]
MKSVAWGGENVSRFDCVVIATHHRAFDLDQLVAWAPLVVDTRNALSGTAPGTGTVVKP